MTKKNIVIFGGNGALGKKLSEKLNKENYLVISADKGNKGFKRVKSDLYVANADVVNLTSLKKLKNKIIKNFGRIDVVIYAVTYKSKDFYYSFDKLSLVSWRKIIDTELTGSFLVSQIFGEVFEKQKKEILYFYHRYMVSSVTIIQFIKDQILLMFILIKNKKKKFFLTLHTQQLKVA